MRSAYLLVIAPLMPGACEFDRVGKQALPQAFIGSETRLTAIDIVEITVSVARPRPGALEAYGDCVGAQYALIRGVEYARPITRFSARSGNADILVETTSYLLSDLAPTGTALRADQIVADCRSRNIPTV